MSARRTAVVGGVEVALDHYVGGERLASTDTFEDRSPLDWSMLLGDVARGDASTADAALNAAVDAAPGWAALGPAGRGAILRRLADLIDERTEDLAMVECLDMAMLHESLRLRVIGRGARNFRAYADLAEAYVPRRWSSNGTANEVLRMPAGPTVVITPWNAPFMLSTWKSAPALAAGNTVVLKPAEWSPLSCSLLCDLAEAAGLPPGVLNVVQGLGREVGAALVADERVRRISFTGSPETGRSIGEAAARNLVPFTAELGGKGPLLVFADADLDAAAATAAKMYDDAGQVCLAGTRLLVEASVHDAFYERFRAATDRHVLGDSRDAATTISPLIHPEHLARVEGFVARARAAGDTVVFGGRRWKDDGLWYEPTLIEPRSNDAEIVQREVFGPVLTLQRFADEAEAVALANSTRYGLSAMVFTSDADRARRLGDAIRAGTVWTNCFLVRDLTAPFGGTGISGIGREGGDYTLDFYSELKTTQVKEGTTMGEIVGAAVLSHVPTIVLPDDERRALNNGQESTLFTGLHDVRREVFDVLRPDLVVVFDSHWFTTVEFIVSAQARRAGRYTSEELPRGMHQVPYDVPGDPEFATAMAAASDDVEECWISAIDDECLPIHYPTVNLLGFLQGDEPWVSVSTAQTAATDDFLAVGACVARAVEQLDRRCFLVASGALSHTFWGLRELRAHEAAGEEHIITKEAAAADHAVLDAWARGDHRAVIDGMPTYLSFRPEGRFGHYLMLAAAVGGRDCTARGRAYSAYENAIGTGQAHVVFDRPEGRLDRLMEGLSFPRTPSGQSSILPPLPWHYSGDLLTVEYRTNPGAVRALLPDELALPHDDEDPGAVAVIWADWQACSDDGRELDDPVRLQYKEAFVVVRCRWRDQLWSRCVFIWVDKDFAMVRGHLQGYPKKLGAVQVSRPVSVGRGGPRLEPGGRFGATLAAYDRRLAQATVTLTGASEHNGFVNSLPMLHHRFLARIEGDGTDTFRELVTMRGRDVELSAAWRGDATLELFDSPVEELASLEVREVLGGYFRSVGTTFAGGETLETGT